MTQPDDTARDLAIGPSLQDQIERLNGWRDGFQAVYIVATGVQAGFFDELAAHAEGLTAEALAQQTACHPPYVAIWCTNRDYQDLSKQLR